LIISVFINFDLIKVNKYSIDRVVGEDFGSFFTHTSTILLELETYEEWNFIYEMNRLLK